MNKIVDAREKKCPMPIILTKKCIDSSVEGDSIEVIIDNEIARRNLSQYLTELGLSFEEVIGNNEFRISFVIGNVDVKKGVEDIVCPVEPSPSVQKSDYVIAISGDTMGKGEDELGKTLMRSYINVLKDLDTLPQTIIFFNSGVKLVNRGADTVESLKEIESLGVNIICCGVCIDYYGVDIAVGNVSNMFKIGNTMAEASKVVYP